jgi:predicted RNA-binding protein associated with RNAse of E/G family
MLWHEPASVNVAGHQPPRRRGAVRSRESAASTEASGCYSGDVLNRKFADLRHAPDLDPHVLRFDRERSPQAIVRIGPAAHRKTKGGVILGEAGFTWALFFFPDRWYAITTIRDGGGALVAHHVDLCRPPEERDGMLSFLDLKLDLILTADGARTWVDQDDYQREIEAGTISLAWQAAVAETTAALDRECRAGRFPPAVVQQYLSDAPIGS